MTYSESEFLLFAILLTLLMVAISEALSTLFYCIRMRAYERAILAAKDCDKLVVHPPFRLWKKFTASEGTDHVENTPRK